MAEDQKERAICIVLSGTGTDGTLGVKAVKGESGMAMVQQPQSAKYAGMPSSAIATGLADYVLPPAAMPNQLVAYANGPYLTAAAVAAESPSVPEEPMQKIFVMLRQTDIGRPISELASNLEYDDLAADCRDVLKTLVFKEAEVETKDGGVYMRRIMPYRTAENVIDGLVLTFVNISQLRKAEQVGELARAYFESIVETVREPLIVLDEQLRVVSANRSFYRAFRATPRQTEGELIYELGAGQWDIAKLRELLEGILPRNTTFEDYEVEVDLPKVGRRVFVLNARRMEQPERTGDLILLALEDMTAN